MSEARSRKVLIAGAGIAGLTAALAFAARGFPVRVFERTPRLEETGAGLQLSPNATRILARLGVLPALLPLAVQPEAVVLRDATSLAKIGQVPLGAAAERRWKAPYLAVHRADLQRILLQRLASEADIDLLTGATVGDVTIQPQGVTVSTDTTAGRRHASGLLLVGADGVWSTLRGFGGTPAGSRFAGQLAWRRLVSAERAEGQGLAAMGAQRVVTAFLNPGFHLIVYPVRGGATFNLVAFTPGPGMVRTWSGRTDTAPLKSATRAAAPALSRLFEDAAAWTAWPVHTVDRSRPWTAPGGIALIGDAAHAMTPFAAQGAAMAIEDAETLAAAVADRPHDLDRALRGWELERRPRIARVARRGALNRFAWHAGGPIALARNLFLRLRAPEMLAADLDWLYGWEPPDKKDEAPAQL